jgi:hypothetical protein
MSADVNERRLPSAEDEARFWVLVEAAWAPCSAGANRVRRALAARTADPNADLSAVDGALPVFLGTLADQCRALPGDELTSLDPMPLSQS